MPPVNAVHTAKQNVALGDGFDSFRVEKISGNRVDFRPRSHFADGVSQSNNFKFAAPCVVNRRVQNTVQVFLLNAVRVNDNEPPDSEPCQHFDCRATRA